MTSLTNSEQRKWCHWQAVNWKVTSLTSRELKSDVIDKQWTGKVTSLESSELKSDVNYIWIIPLTVNPPSWVTSHIPCCSLCFHISAQEHFIGSLVLHNPWLWIHRQRVWSWSTPLINVAILAINSNFDDCKCYLKLFINKLSHDRITSCLLFRLDIL